MKTSRFEQKPLRISIHVISWLLIFCFPITQTGWESSFDWQNYLRHALVPLCSFGLFYINFLYLIPRCLFHHQKKTKTFFLVNAILIITFSLLVHYGNMLMLDMICPNYRQIPPPPPPRHIQFFGKYVHLVRHIFVMAFTVILSTVIYVSLRWRETEERLIEAERQKADAELKNLKNQMNPHFLLNTLNNIYALIAFNSEKAQEAVLELSKMLRHILYDNQSAKVSLEKELEFINNYISLMRIRLSKSVKISVKLNQGPRPLQIAPLIFISLIENAFKHGISPTEESFISINIHGEADGKITCEIMNSNFPKNESDKSGSGIGLEQVQQRLELSYPNLYEWNKGISAEGSTYTSILTIQSTEL
ncbi:MAG: histidine kinase [Bacteroides sp.]|nr:histidine kinase [Bacteroides sp.]